MPKRGARRVRIVADVATVALFLVVLVGFLDTLTHSALGCGPMWPLCNGGVLSRREAASGLSHAGAVRGGDADDDA